MYLGGRADGIAGPYLAVPLKDRSDAALPILARVSTSASPIREM